MPGAIEKNRAGGHKSAGGRWPGCAHGVGLKDLLAAVLIMALTAAVLLSLIADMHRRADAEASDCSSTTIGSPGSRRRRIGPKPAM